MGSVTGLKKKKPYTDRRFIFYFKIYTYWISDGIYLQHRKKMTSVFLTLQYGDTQKKKIYKNKYITIRVF